MNVSYHDLLLFSLRLDESTVQSESAVTVFVLHDFVAKQRNLLRGGARAREGNSPYVYIHSLSWAGAGWQPPTEGIIKS